MQRTAWPLWVWSLQLLPALLLVSFAIIRLETRLAGTVDLQSWFILIAGAIWAILVLAMLTMVDARRWLIERRRDWGMSVVVVLIVLLVADVGLTVGGIVPTISAQRAQSLEYTQAKFAPVTLLPKITVGNDGVPLIINRRGFRGNEIEAAKPHGEQRIVFVGGSQVFDYQGGGWPGMVGKQLRERGHQVRIINAGVPSHTSNDSLAKLLTEIWLLAPDVIVFCNGWNDIKYFPRMHAALPARGLPQMDGARWEDDWRMHPRGLDRWLSMSAIYRAIRVRLIEARVGEEGRWSYSPDSAGVDPAGLVPGANGPRQFALSLTLAAAFARDIEADLVLCRQARLENGAGLSGVSVAEYGRRNVGMEAHDLRTAFAAIDAVTANVARAESLPVLDMHHIFGNKPELFHDPIHFSPAGSRLAAVAVATQLEPLLTAAE